MKKLILAAAVVAAFALPAGAFGGTFTGVVVGKSGSNLAVASKYGTVRTVHTRAQCARWRPRACQRHCCSRARSCTPRAHPCHRRQARGRTRLFLPRAAALLAIHSSGRRLSSLPVQLRRPGPS